MGIFDKQPEKSEFDKIGVNVVRIFMREGRWVFRHGDGVYDMAPAGITDAVLSPVVLGADRMIRAGCSIKNIPDPEGGFNLLFSEQQFPGCDVQLSYVESRFDGWVYDVEPVNLGGVMAWQQAWVCPYLTFYFDQPPRIIYLKMEPKDGVEEAAANRT